MYLIYYEKIKGYNCNQNKKGLVFIFQVFNFTNFFKDVLYDFLVIIFIFNVTKFYFVGYKPSLFEERIAIFDKYQEINLFSLFLLINSQFVFKVTYFSLLQLPSFTRFSFFRLVSLRFILLSLVIFNSAFECKYDIYQSIH